MSDAASADPAGARADAYRDMRLHCLEIVAQLDDEAAELTVPCCPAWSIHDLLAHLAGVPDDILTGRLDGVTTDAWTDAQVVARRQRTLAELAAELADRGAGVEALLRSGVEFPAPFFVDAWTHEWDLRHAVGAAAVPDLALVGPVLAHLIGSFGRQLDEAGAAPVDVVIDATATRAGTIEDRVPISLTVDAFTFVRATMGRRSRPQLEALSWGDDVTPAHVDELVVFGIAAHDIVDPVLPRLPT